MRRLRAAGNAVVENRGSGAPRPMKMGTTRSLCPYDPAARYALQSASLRRPAISCCVQLTIGHFDILMPAGYPSIAAFSLNPRIDVMGHEETRRDTKRHEETWSQLVLRQLC
jgi:hypothetical protein